MLKVNRLKKGSTIGIISPSWSGPNVFPLVYETGLKNLQDNFNFRIKEFKSTRAPYDSSIDYVLKRVEDIHAAFSDKEVEAIFLSIGGDDAVRLLPYLKPEILVSNPKIVMGFSDSTNLLIYLAKLGIPSFHGPSVMAGFAEPEGLPQELVRHFEDFFFNAWDMYTYPVYTKWTEDRSGWNDPEFLKRRKVYQTNSRYRLINKGSGKPGKLLGGCIEILEMIKGTGFGISDTDWVDATLFFETSEDKPSVDYVKYALRSYGVAGAWNKVSNVIIGKARGYSEQEYTDLENTVKKVIVDEFGANNVTIVSNYDIGHTQPIHILPLSCNAHFDDNLNLTLLESPFK